MSNTMPNRISVRDLEGVRAWRVPDFENAKKVLPSAEKEARLRREQEQRSAGEIVGETLEAEAHQPITAAQLQEITDAAHKEGFDAGFAEGQQAGFRSGEAQALEETRARMDQQIARLGSLIENLFNPVEDNNAQLERVVLDTIVMLTRSVVKREVQQEESNIRDLVQEAVRALPVGSDNLTIHLHPDDVPLLDSFYLERSARWSLSADPNLLPGGCRVETKQSLVNFSVEERLKQMCEQFLRGELMSAEDEDDEADLILGSETGALSTHSLSTTESSLASADTPQRVLDDNSEVES